jgi:hypothetical protein
MRMAMSEDEEDVILWRLKFIERRIRLIAEACIAATAIVVGLCVYWFLHAQVEIGKGTAGTLAMVVGVCCVKYMRRLLNRE